MHIKLDYAIKQNELNKNEIKMNEKIQNFREEKYKMSKEVKDMKYG